MSPKQSGSSDPLEGKEVSGASATPDGHTTVYQEEDDGKGWRYSYDVEDGKTKTGRHTVDQDTDEKIDYPDEPV